MADTKTQLSKTTITLHWVVGWTIIALLAMGIYMEENKVYALYDLHKSLGVIIFLVILTRVVWRIMQGWPEPVGTYSKIEQILGKAVHYILLIGSVLIPLSGMMMSGAGGHGVEVFGLELIGANPDPNDPNEVIPLSPMMAQLGHTMHGLVSNIVIAALVLHIVGALKHHFKDRDNTLRRMLGKPLN